MLELKLRTKGDWKLQCYLSRAIEFLLLTWLFPEHDFSPSEKADFVILVMGSISLTRLRWDHSRIISHEPQLISSVKKFRFSKKKSKEKDFDPKNIRFFFRFRLPVSDWMTADNMYSSEGRDSSDSEQFGAFENYSCENSNLFELFGESSGFCTGQMQSLHLSKNTWFKWFDINTTQFPRDRSILKLFYEQEF